MKKLEDIPKKEIFNVPDGYFDALPGKIQARIAAKNSTRETSFIFRYVLPVIALLFIGIYWYTNDRQPVDAESILASVQTEDMIVYLDDSGITTEDLLEHIDFNASDLEAIENEVYELHLSDEALKEIIDDLESENTSL